MAFRIPCVVSFEKYTLFTFANEKRRKWMLELKIGYIVLWTKKSNYHSHGRLFSLLCPIKKRCSKLMNNIHVFRTKYFNIHIVNKLGRYLDLSIKIDKKWSCDMPIMLSELPWHWNDIFRIIIHGKQLIVELRA